MASRTGTGGRTTGSSTSGVDHRYWFVQLYEVFLEATVQPVVDRAARRASRAAGAVQDTTQAALLRVQQIIATAIIGGTVLVVLLWLATVVYALFYWLYVPAIQHVHPVYFQFDPKYEKQPQAFVDMTGGVQRRLLHSNQEYDVSVRMRVPDSEVNQQEGMFMVNVALLNYRNETIHWSTRPTTLQYSSALVRTMNTLTFGVPLALGWMTQVQHINVPLLEEIYDGSAYTNAITRASLTLSKPRIEVYEASIHIEARFSGIRYFMYNWFLITAFVCIGTITAFESLVVFMLYLYFFGLSGSGHKRETPPNTNDSLGPGDSQPTSIPPSQIPGRASMTSRRRSPVARTFEGLTRSIEEGREPNPLLEEGEEIATTTTATIEANEGVRRRRTGGTSVGAPERPLEGTSGGSAGPGGRGSQPRRPLDESSSEDVSFSDSPATANSAHRPATNRHAEKLRDVFTKEQQQSSQPLHEAGRRVPSIDMEAESDDEDEYDDEDDEDDDDGDNGHELRDAEGGDPDAVVPQP